MKCLLYTFFLLKITINNQIIIFFIKCSLVELQKIHFDIVPNDLPKLDYFQVYSISETVQIDANSVIISAGIVLY